MRNNVIQYGYARELRSGMGLKENIKLRRLKLKMTISALADKVGVSRATMQRYESGRIANIPSEKVEKIAAALMISPGELMGWDEGDGSEEQRELEGYLDELKTRSELRMLFRLASTASREDVEKAVRVVEALFSK